MAGDKGRSVLRKSWTIGRLLHQEAKQICSHIPMCQGGQGFCREQPNHHIADSVSMSIATAWSTAVVELLRPRDNDKSYGRST